MIKQSILDLENKILLETNDAIINLENEKATFKREAKQ